MRFLMLMKPIEFNLNWIERKRERELVPYMNLKDVDPVEPHMEPLCEDGTQPSSSLPWLPQTRHNPPESPLLALPDWRIPTVEGFHHPASQRLSLPGLRLSPAIG